MNPAAAKNRVNAISWAAVFMLATCSAHPGVAAADDARLLADQIDQYIARRWQAENVTPASRATDAEFMRRVYLDIGGKIPPVSELREFLNDSSSDKRHKLVDRLLAGPNYIAHFSTLWRKAMIPEVDSDLQVRFLAPSFEAWLRDQLRSNAGYDKIVRQLVSAPVSERMFDPYGTQNELTPLAFFRAKQLQPENLAASVSRAFLGVRIGCAQCHDHPFEAWKREDFWSFAAFFAGIERTGPPEQGVFASFRELKDRRELEIPNSDNIVQASFLDGNEPRWRFKTGPRTTLADWLTSGENPYFARATANRIWAHFFGIGIVDPLDDFGTSNPPSHPELLDLLARALVAHQFDIQFLIRAITISNTYSLSSIQTNETQQDQRLFARYHLRRLSAEQLFNSLAEATGDYQPFNIRNQFDLSGSSWRAEIGHLFSGNSQSSRAQHISILQALVMMNGSPIAEATTLKLESPNSEPNANRTQTATLSAVVEFPLAGTEDRVETLYMSALSRKPTTEELARMVNYVESGGPSQDSRRALADVFWVLLNSSEFVFNH